MGSGKTGAFSLPILNMLLDCHSKELAIQISDQFKALGSGISLRCAVLVGGVDLMKQQIALGKRPHIISFGNKGDGGMADFEDLREK
ncbi:hypothetical protein V6N11_001358 [Hibiscus sabdariffa]|uniref:DEAD/DEAH-box helicase domain-containing protein n=1 Tax=Hibiscus sabdariffa TaxID=183260 RepID=A0ABR2S0B5_9ROSI